MTKSQLADKIDRALSGGKDTVFLKAAEWQMVLDALREPVRAISSSRLEYVVPASASHGER